MCLEITDLSLPNSFDICSKDSQTVSFSKLTSNLIFPSSDSYIINSELFFFNSIYHPKPPL